MAKLIFTREFREKIDDIDTMIDNLKIEKARMLLKEIGIDSTEYRRMLDFNRLLTFEVPDKGICRQLNAYCDDKM